MGCIRAVEERWRISRLTGDSAGTESGNSGGPPMRLEKTDFSIKKKILSVHWQRKGQQ